MLNFVTGVYDSLKRWYEVTIGDLPWIKAASIVAPLTGVAIYFNKQLPQEFSVDLSNANKYVVFSAVVFVIYFLLVAVFYQTRLNVERQLRRLEQSFRYDRRGTLYNGGQPNIAFRVVTFKGILAGLADFVNYETLQRALLKAGSSAAQDFANNLPTIFDEDVQSRKGGNRWAKLPIDDKLSHWMDYDSATGWGILSAERQGDSVVIITVNHQKGLVEGPGGMLFTCFLGGYCRTVLTSIVSAHTRGPFRDFSKAVLTALSHKGNNVVEFRFELR